MNRLFSMDNKFFVFMGKVADLCLLNLVCLICCIPIVTAGASLTALYYVTLKMVRNEEAYIFRSFFKSFRQNFKQATIIHLIMVAAAVLLYLDTTIVKAMGEPVSSVMSVIFAVFTMIYVMILLYLYPILAKFYNSVKNTFTNAILMAIRHLPYTVIMLIISALPVLIFFVPSFQAQMTLILLFLLFGFAVVAYCNSYFFVKVFDKYIPAEEEETDKGAA
ncbi:MAG TPA: YesL family protein [Candidatus Blautia faecipullorum]|nr:YesL family protein [Candidatus Blautia faecipullorum]